MVSGDTSTLKDGELLGTFRFMPPDLIDKLAVTDEQRQAMRGKSGFAFVSDWADAGRPYVTRLGRKIDVLMGGMGYPFLPEISGKGAWAGTFSTMTDRVMDKIKATDGIGLVVLGGPESSASSRAFSRAFGEELADSMSQNPKLKEKLDAIARDAREKLIEYRRGKDKSINVPEINNLDDWARLTQLERVGEETENGLTFEDRAFLVRTIGAHDNKKALGIRSWKDVLRNYNLQNKDFTPGQVVAVVQFSGAEPVRAETIGAKPHPSYEALIPGNAIGTLPKKTMIKDVFRKYFASEETEPPSFTRKVQTAMPEFVVGKGDMRFMPSDTDYLSAVKQGDTAKAKEMVNAAAKAAGYLDASELSGPKYNEGDPVYHNTTSKFTVFEPGKNGLIQFTPSKTLFGKRGDIKVAVYLKEPVIRNSTGLILSVKDPSQVKLADPITKDDAGNVIPLSQRFKATSEDIRYMPSPDSAMPGAYSFPGGYRAIPGKAKGSLRLYGPEGSLIGISSSLDEAQRILRRKGNR